MSLLTAANHFSRRFGFFGTAKKIVSGFFVDVFVHVGTKHHFLGDIIIISSAAN